MESHPLADAIREYLTDYVTEAPSPEAAKRLAAGLVVEESLVMQELQILRQVLGSLAHTAPPVTPPPGLRDRLMQRVAQEAAGAREPTAEPVAPTTQPSPTDFVYIREDEGVWQDLAPGISAKFLYTDPDTDRRTAIFRMDPGTQLPPHQHLAVEELFVLDGDCHVAHDRVLRAGDYFRAPAGSQHELTYTEEGTTFISMFHVVF